MTLFESMQALNPTENKKILDSTVYFAYFGGKLVDSQGFLSDWGHTATTRQKAITALRKAKKRAMRKYWGRLDYIIKYGEKKITIYPENF
jgi:hypothetical protein